MAHGWLVCNFCPAARHSRDFEFQSMFTDEPVQRRSYSHSWIRSVCPAHRRRRSLSIPSDPSSDQLPLNFVAPCQSVKHWSGPRFAGQSTVGFRH